MSALAKFKNRKDSISAFVQNLAKRGFILPMALTSSSRWYWENCLVLPICLCLLCSSVKWDFLQGTFMAKGRKCEIGVINIWTCIFIWRKSPLDSGWSLTKNGILLYAFLFIKKWISFCYLWLLSPWKLHHWFPVCLLCTLWKKWKYFFLNFRSAFNGTNATIQR